MSMNFKKTAIAAGMFTALAATSMSAHAVRETEAGEANLVPFVLWSSSVFDNNPTIFGINTVIKLTVPMSVGNDVIPNFYTAIHTSPTNGTINKPGKQKPADPDLVPSNTVHWYFMDQTSVHRLNGTIDVTPEDVAVLDWGAFVRKNGKQGEFDGFPGYMVLVTEAGAGGDDADFSFFAEAWMFAGVRAGANPDTGGVIGIVDAKIPVMPMSDGADNGSKKPTVENSVIEAGVNQSVIASPLVAGIRTNWSDGNGSDVTVVDLTLGNRNVPIGNANLINALQVPTLLVVWNDRNAGGKWSGLGVDIYNDKEEKCSDSIDLPYQLNLVWAQTDVTAGKNAQIPFDWPVPKFISGENPYTGKPFGLDKIFCVPPYQATPVTDPDGAIALEQLLQGGFMKLYLPELIDTGIGAPESAAVAWSVPLQYFVTLETDPATGDWVPTDISLIPFETALGHDRGLFSQAP
ncbi:conserved exported protein of unknown function [Methylococcus capsulatus]|uniref:Uncharacterized protein n=2 Tax=Methylococcus capsulatus TaxID=414 RepID=A0AA35UL68_METCP|nr:conserved exported protein of unknown function [Methylococcus capsulatus]